MAVVSGTVSEATGGKFANGAISGAFIHMFNNEVQNMLSITNENKRIQNTSYKDFSNWLSEPSSYSYEYNCHTASNCHVTIRSEQ